MNSKCKKSLGGQALAIGALLLAGVSWPASAARASGPNQFSYSVHFDRAVTESLPGASAPCGVDATVTTDVHVSATVVTTVGGLTQGQVASLVDSDPDGIVRQVHITAFGRLMIIDAAHTYTGRVTQQFSGNFLPNGKYVQTGTLSATGKSEIGTSFRFNGGGHDVDDFDGVTVHFNSHGSSSGCLA